MSHEFLRREGNNFEAEVELRRGPWTLEEDTLLIHCIALHGEGRWNLLARTSGLKRTGKSCRLRWLNYLKPDVKRGNLSQEEQLLILELHSKWGNRWSRIAQHLPGRTDNEIKNYWRTKMQKHARKSFSDAQRCYRTPRLLVRSSPSSPYTAELETTHQRFNKVKLFEATAEPNFIKPIVARLPFGSGGSENCSPSVSIWSAELAHQATGLGDIVIDPSFNGDCINNNMHHDDLDLAAEMLQSPTETAYIDGSNYAEYSEFSDGLWN